MKVALFGSFLGAMLLAGCSQNAEMPAHSRIGDTCAVQFRRDALGAAAPNGIPPNTGSMNGAEMALHGTLRSAYSDWIVISDGRVDQVIPTHAILYVQFDAAAKKP